MELSSKKIKIVYYGNPIYSVNEEKRTVTCVLYYRISIPSLDDNTGIDPNSQLGKPSNHVHPYTGSLMHVRSYAMYEGKPLKVIGRAVCSPEDEFNEEIGKKIALTKAENKAYGDTLCIVDAAVSEITAAYTELVGIFAERMINIIKSNGAYLEKLTGDKFDFKKYIGDDDDEVSGGASYSRSNSYDSTDIPYEVTDIDTGDDDDIEENNQ